MGVYDELSKLSTVSPAPKSGHEPMGKKQGVTKKDTLVDQATDQSTERSTTQPTGQPTDPLVDIDALGPVVDRPRAFYITQKVDRWLDNGVRYLRERGIHKADRSVLVNALLHDPALYKPSHLEKIRKRLLAHMTNKSLKRVQ